MTVTAPPRLPEPPQPHDPGELQEIEALEALIEEARQRARRRRRRMCWAVATWLALSGVLFITVVGRPGPPLSASSGFPALAGAPEDDEAASEVATAFLEAYGAFDLDKAISYLADDADILETIDWATGRL